MKHGWMIYGANGYTGRLIAEVAARRGLRPIVAGRRREAIDALAREHGFESRVFEVEDIGQHLDGVGAVLLAAGPFVHTSKPVVDACIAHGCHYLDITGEVEIFEMLRARDAEARRAKVALIPGVGFDVVPSDCLAATLAAALPGATSLELAITGSELSAGTAKTMLEHLGQGGCVRENGEIRRVPLGWKTRTVHFADKTRHAVTIPWGDVSTAHHSTGIGNIRVYAAARPSQVWQMRAMRLLTPVLNFGPVRRGLQFGIERLVQGPDAETRHTRKAQLWGRASTSNGRTVEATLTTPEPYALTAETAVEATRRALEGVEPGFQTASTAFGRDFVLSFEGVELLLPEVSAPVHPLSDEPEPATTLQ